MSWGWDAQKRGYLAALHDKGAVAARYEVHYSKGGCSVDLELLSNCHADGVYQFQPQPVTDFKLVHNDNELFARLPLGAAGVRGQLAGDRAYRADFMYAGIDSLPLDAAYRVDDLKGVDCQRATHIINRVYLGGFAWAFGESRELEATASLFSASAGAQAHARVGQVHTEGSAESCKVAQESGKLLYGCRTPLHIGLLPIQGVSLDLCDDLSSCTLRCEGGEASSCNQLGLMYVEGRSGVKKDLKRAADLFDRACRDSNAWGCLNLGSMHRNGEGVPRNPQYAAALFDGACVSGAALACVLLGEMAQRGEGVPADISRAVDYYDKACSAGRPEGCEGEIPLLNKFCNDGYSEGCAELGRLYGGAPGVALDVDRACELFGRACDLGNAAACTQRGVLYENGAGKRPDPARAAVLYETACKGNDVEGCLALGTLYENGTGVQQDLGYAVSLYRKACDNSLQRGCVYLGDMYREGSGVKPDLNYAAKLFEGACDDEDANGCESLARMYEGTGDAKDRPDAVRLYKVACTLGAPRACDAANRLEAAR